MKLFTVVLLLLISINLVCENSPNIDDQIKLINFYLNEGEFDNAIVYADSAMQQAECLDSLNYFKAVAFKAKEAWEEATIFFGNAILVSNDEQFIDALMLEYKCNLAKLPIVKSIEINANLLKEIETSKLQIVFMKIMAELYEKINLLEEANDVYKTILQFDFLEQPLEIEMKMVQNLILLKNYEAALFTLQIVFAAQDSAYIIDALYFDYLASYALNNFASAKTSLLKLYCDFPEHPKKYEILKGLADIFSKEEKYFVAWYFLEEMCDISNKYQKADVELQIIELKNMVLNDSLRLDYFENFELNLPECSGEIYFTE